jgi:hypothetical protein
LIELDIRLNKKYISNILKTKILLNNMIIIMNKDQSLGNNTNTKQNFWKKSLWQYMSDRGNIKFIKESNFFWMITTNNNN